MKRFLVALAFLAGVAPAWAQSSIPTANQDARVPLFALACIDAQGRALPPGSSSCVSSQSTSLPANAAQETGGNLAALLARTPALGQATKAQSQPVVLPSDQGPLTTSPNACATTQTIVTGTGGTLIAANANRKSLRWMNVGAADVTVSPGTAAPVVGQGMVYASTAAGKQGGGETYPDAAVASNAFAYAASASATVAVWECQ